MTRQLKSICERLKRLGFTKENRMGLYGQEYELISDPFVLGDNVIFVDAIETKSQQQRRVRIPLPLIKIPSDERSAE